MEDFPADLTLAYGEEQIDIYYNAILDYLVSQKLNMKPRQYMKTYNCVVKLSDEYNISEDLYRLYKEKIEAYIKIIEGGIKPKVGDAHEFLQENH